MSPDFFLDDNMEIIIINLLISNVSADYLFVNRIGINPTNSNHNNNNNSSTNTGQEWGVMAGPDPPQQGLPSTPIVGVALGAGGLGWVVDRRGRMFFREGVCDAYPQGQDLRWWQVCAYLVIVCRAKATHVVLFMSCQASTSMDLNICRAAQTPAAPQYEPFLFTFFLQLRKQFKGRKKETNEKKNASHTLLLQKESRVLPDPWEC